MEIKEFDEKLYYLVKEYLDSHSIKGGDYKQINVFAMIAALEARKICLIHLTLGKYFVYPNIDE